MTYTIPTTYTSGDTLPVAQWNHVATNLALLQNSAPALSVANFLENMTPPQQLGGFFMGSILQHLSITCDGSGVAALSWIPFSDGLAACLVYLINPEQFTVGVQTGSLLFSGCNIVVWDANANAAAAGYTGTVNVLVIGF